MYFKISLIILLNLIFNLNLVQSYNESEINDYNSSKSLKRAREDNDPFQSNKYRKVEFSINETKNKSDNILDLTDTLKIRNYFLSRESYGHFTSLKISEEMTPYNFKRICQMNPNLQEISFHQNANIPKDPLYYSWPTGDYVFYTHTEGKIAEFEYTKFANYLYPAIKTITLNDFYAGLASLKHLTTLNFSGIFFGTKTVKNVDSNFGYYPTQELEFFEVLRSLSSLQTLDLSCNNFTYEGLKTLAHHPSLTFIDLSESIEADGIFDIVQTLPHLTYLNTNGNILQDSLQAAESLLECHSLRSLHLYSVKEYFSGFLDDEFAIALAPHPSLIELDLGGNNISEKGARAFTLNKVLKNLEI